VDVLHTAEQHNDLGNSLKRAGNVAEAVEHYREALRLKPRWAEAHINLGLGLRALGDMPAALAQFRLAVRVRADHTEARNNLGVTLSDLGQLAEAEATYKLVLRHRPGAADTHNNLGVVLVQRSKRAEAIGHYRRALEIRSNYAEAHNNLGNALRHEEKFEDAEACLLEALRLRPEYAEAYNSRLARCEVDRGRVRDERALDDTCTELGSLLAARARCAKSPPELQRLAERLRAVNDELLQMDEEVRPYVQKQYLGAQFAELAGRILSQHESRAALKREINELLGLPASCARGFSRIQSM
jgi:tetratricopeptide (TPR) repeat protein